MVARVRRDGEARNARLVRTPVVPRDVAYSDTRAARHSRRIRASQVESAFLSCAAISRSRFRSDPMLTTWPMRDTGRRPRHTPPSMRFWRWLLVVQLPGFQSAGLNWITTKGRICLTCATPIHPRKRADALFCSPRCYQRALRVVAKRREFESLRELVRDDMREIREGWRWAEKSNPSGYHGTPVGHQLTEEMLRIEALFDRRERSNCEHCGRRTTMRKSRKYCSTRCRVAAHRDAARVRA
jgi:hypothetical protein